MPDTAITISNMLVSVSVEPGTDTSVYDLLPILTVEVAACPVPAQKQALRLAAREFCIETEIWRETIETTSVEDDDTYVLADSLDGYDADIWRILSLELDDSDVDATDYTFGPTGILTFDNAPDESDETIVAETVLVPRRTCTSYPYWLITQWGDVIVSNAVSRLKSQMGRPWTDPAGAEREMLAYRLGCGRAKGMVVSGREGGNWAIQGREFI